MRVCYMKLLIDKGKHVKFDENQYNLVRFEPLIDKLYVNQFYVTISLELALNIFKITLIYMII